MAKKPKPSLLVRADASTTVGTGHFVRCFALAKELSGRDWDISFAARRLPEPLQRALSSVGHRLVTIPESVPTASEPDYLADVTSFPYTLLLVDHYGLGVEWQRRAARLAGTMAAIDDLARSEQAVDVLLNQNLGFTPTDYDGLVRMGGRLLIGPQYALLRPEFPKARAAGLRVRDQVQRILIFLSGGDTHNVTRRVVEALVGIDAAIDVVVGGAYPHAGSLQALAVRNPQLEVHENTQDMARLMLLADLAVGAPSSASWERCCLGLPAITITLAENQTRVAHALSRVGATISLGWYHSVDASAVVDAVAELSQSPSRLREMSRIAAGITDGEGAQRVADVLAQVATSGEVEQEGTE